MSNSENCSPVANKNLAGSMSTSLQCCGKNLEGSSSTSKSDLQIADKNLEESNSAPNNFLQVGQQTYDTALWMQSTDEAVDEVEDNDNNVFEDNNDNGSLHSCSSSTMAVDVKVKQTATERDGKKLVAALQSAKDKDKASARIGSPT